MAYLSDTDRARVWRVWMRYWLSIMAKQIPPCTKADFRAAIDATDEWIDDNQGSFNANLPNPFKTNASTDDKTALFCMVAIMRAGGPEWMIRMFGVQVD